MRAVSYTHLDVYKRQVMVNAINKIGQTQTPSLLFNPAGYNNNVMQNITLNAS